MCDLRQLQIERISYRDIGNLAQFPIVPYVCVDSDSQFSAALVQVRKSALEILSETCVVRCRSSKCGEVVHRSEVGDSGENLHRSQLYKILAVRIGFRPSRSHKTRN